MELLGFTLIQIECGQGQSVLVKILGYEQFRNNQTLTKPIMGWFWVWGVSFLEYKTTKTKF